MRWDTCGALNWCGRKRKEPLAGSKRERFAIAKLRLTRLKKITMAE